MKLYTLRVVLPSSSKCLLFRCGQLCDSGTGAVFACSRWTVSEWTRGKEALSVKLVKYNVHSLFTFLKTGT